MSYRFVLSRVKNCSASVGSCCNMSTGGKAKVFVTRNDYPEVAIKLLQKHTDVEVFNGTNIKKEEIIKGIKGKDALYCSLNDKIDKDVIAAGDKLKVIGTMSVGLDHIDWKLCKEKGIKIGYTTDVLTQAVSELGMALLLATSRRLFEAHNEIIEGRWSSWSPMWMCGPGLHKSTFGIVGFGNIGSEVARKVKPFQVDRILYTDSNSAKEKPAAVEVGACRVLLDELLEESDFVMVTCALTDQTRGLFNKEKFALMKPTAIFINISRGATVIQDDLQEALECNIIRAAGLDVMDPEPLPKDHPLVFLPNCVTLPHIGSATERSRIDMGLLTTNNILAGLEGKPLPKEWIK